MANSVDAWNEVQSNFDRLARDGYLCRYDFAQCIGMKDSKEFALELFTLSRKRRLKAEKISKEELSEFWLQITDQSFDSPLHIFFDMVDKNEDGRVTEEEVKELMILRASANKLSRLKEQVEEYAALIMEELDPERLCYIESSVNLGFVLLRLHLSLITLFPDSCADLFLELDGDYIIRTTIFWCHISMFYPRINYNLLHMTSIMTGFHLMKFHRLLLDAVLKLCSENKWFYQLRW